MAGFRYYIEKDGRPVRVEDGKEWNEWCKTTNRLIEKTKVGPVKVVTLFLGLDHLAEGAAGLPLVYETVIDGGVLDGKQWLYATREEAQQGHLIAVRKAKRMRFSSWWLRVMERFRLR